MTFNPDTDLKIERLINAAPETIWRCWAEPELFKQWFVPHPVEVTEVDNDLRPGGRAFNVMKLPDGTLMENDGCFLLVDRYSRLVFTDGVLSGFRPSPNPAFMTGRTKYHLQVIRYANGLPRLRRSDWVVSLDVDEFICVNAGQGRLEDLFEATDDALNRLRGILTALDHLNDATPRANEGSPESDAVCVMIQVAREKLVEIEELRRAEWAAVRDK